MEKRKFEGLVEICENGDVQFKSGLPESEPAVTWPLLKKRGVMTPFKNGDFAFVADGPCGVLPPSIDLVLRGQGVTVKRTSRNYIVTMKVPVMESAEETTRGHSSHWRQAFKAIKEDREKIKEVISH